MCTKFGRQHTYNRMSTYRQRFQLRIIHGNLHTLNLYERKCCLFPFRFRRYFYRRKCHKNAMDGPNGSKQERKDSINYICMCVFKARPHILTRTHEMRIYYTIVIGRTPHFLSPYMYVEEMSCRLEHFVFFSS